MNLMNDLMAVSVARRVAAAERYGALVRDAADGLDQAPMSALDIPAAAGKSADDFAEDVLRQRERLSAAAVLAEQSVREQRRADAEARVAALEVERDEAAERLRLARVELTDRVREVTECSVARKLLVRTAPAELLGERDRLNQAAGEAERLVRAVKARIAEVEAIANRPDPPAPRWGLMELPGEKETRQSVIDENNRARAALPRLRDQLAEAEAEVVRVGVATAAVVSRMLVL